MQNKKENQKHWKDKLEETRSFPVASADKDLAWQKLSTRLQKKQRRKSAVWYWLAAACLLPLILFVMLNYTKDEISTVKNVAHKPAVTQPSVAIKKAQEEKAVTSTDQVITIKKNVSQPHKQRVETATIARKEMQPPIDSIVTNNTTAIALPKDSINNIASVTPPQKSKLKVVHINELNEPYESAPEMAHNSYPKFLPLQFAKESVYPGSLKTISETGFISLKRKSIN